jgi:L-ribulose-5-phosphate 4-epimerase
MDDHRALRERVCEANLEIMRMDLVILTWGNASEVDRDAGVFAIKPSGVDYGELTPEEIAVVDLESGEQVGGVLKPSSDTPTHWQLYRSFENMGGIVHTHSEFATAWAQAYCPIPCFGTTHADYFHGAVPCTRPLNRDEVEGEYELNTGRLIAAHFAEYGINAAEMPAVLAGGHGPFTWGGNAMDAVHTSAVLETVAKMAYAAQALNSKITPISQFLMDKHFFRKHGADAYYGQA